ncbi:TIGR00296 family protein [Candidatus Methanomassiliicoccus intestinalis]|uniref:Protein MMINT_03410 n=1 Tax=Methanomassiliicoccus intestinalis (strain Issoire-Mx1) TaxID=1295009 RepID=R9T4V1_METII|nr:TIGR00296 family protein [Candidatus Methanomassiliicoccus intestinalis]AGN25735.1 AMMECR1 domain-containing protein [Candidatus Methanomassiliicoccus intestinalis Issoire-Mx1]
MDEDEGIFAVQLARSAVDAEISNGKVNVENTSPLFNEKRGVFVTLKTYPDGELRGCIGFSEPVYPLADAIIMAAESACHDPRFNDLTDEETITVEVSILTIPELLSVAPEDRPGAVEIGKDGLIVEQGYYKGLLLPQVATEWGWDSEEFLSHACAKAGLRSKAWKSLETRVFKFQAEIFSETSPSGDIRRYEGQ